MAEKGRLNLVQILHIKPLRAYPTASDKIGRTRNFEKDRPDHGKIAKSAAGYLYRPGTQYTCAECGFATKDKSRCTYLLSDQSAIVPAAGCNTFAAAAPGTYTGPASFTKAELGYTHSQYGFTCKRCEYFQKPGNCEKVDRNSMGDTPGTISPGACCNHWEPHPLRGSLKVL